MGRLELLARANRFHINMVYIQTAYLPKCFGIKSDRNFIVFCDLRCCCCCCCSCLVILFSISFSLSLRFDGFLSLSPYNFTFNEFSRSLCVYNFELAIFAGLPDACRTQCCTSLVLLLHLKLFV